MKVLTQTIKILREEKVSPSYLPVSLNYCGYEELRVFKGRKVELLV